MTARPTDDPPRWPLTLASAWEALYRRRNPEQVVQHSTVGGETLSFKEVNAKANCLAAYLISKGVQPGEPVVVLSANIGLYLSLDLAVQFAGALNVTVSQDFSSAQLVHILRETQPRFVLISSYALYEQHRGILDSYLDDQGGELLCRTVDGVDLTEADRITMMQNAIEVGKVFWREQAAAVRAPREAAQPDDPCAILYERTDPARMRGAVLSHRNFLQAVAAAHHALDFVNDRDIVLNPLSPAFGLGRLAGYYFPLVLGTQLVQVHQLAALLPAIRQHQPSLVVANPQLLRLLQRRLRQAYAQGWWRKRSLRNAEAAVAAQAAALSTGKPVGRGLKFRLGSAERNVWRKLRSEFLPGVRYFVSDGRGLTPELELFFEALGTPVLSGFGLNETAGLVSLNTPQHRRKGTMGAPVGCADVRLRVNGQAHLVQGAATTEPGALEVRGDSVMLGYWHEGSVAPRAEWLDTGVALRAQQGHLLP